MPRKIKKFKGECLIIGGGWNQSRRFGAWRNRDDFYTIDIDPSVEPDCVVDATSAQSMKEAFQNKRFSFIFFEYFPAWSGELLEKVLANARYLLSDNGAIYYIGGNLGDSMLSRFFNNVGLPNVRREYLGLDDDGYPMYAPVLAWRNPTIRSKQQLLLGLPNVARQLMAEFDEHYHQEGMYSNGCERAVGVLLVYGFSLFSKATKVMYEPFERVAKDDSTGGLDSVEVLRTLNC